MTYIKTGETTFSAVTSVSIDNCFSADYDNYVLVASVSSTLSESSASMQGRLRAGGSDSTGNNYVKQLLAADNTTISASRTSAQGFWGNIIGDNKTGEHGFSFTRLQTPFGAVQTTGWVDYNSYTTGNIALRRRLLGHDLTTSYDGITVFIASGTITGKLTVYGLRES